LRCDVSAGKYIGFVRSLRTTGNSERSHAKIDLSLIAFS
jgi:hypothetical protein